MNVAWNHSSVVACTAGLFWHVAADHVAPQEQPMPGLEW